MATVTTTPGVYIEEDAAPAISVSQSATAVPLFIARFTPLDSKYAGVITRISSWLDFSQKFSSNTELQASVVIKSTKNSQDETKYNYSVFSTEIGGSPTRALQLYFQNGGGACYLGALGDLTDTDQLDALTGLIEEAGDITLIAVPENDDASREAVYGALLTLLEQNKGYFLLADSADGSKPAAISSSAHAAAYYPALLVTPSTPLDFTDESVSVSGYEDAASSSVATLADLKALNADLAAEVSTTLTANIPVSLTIQPSALMAGVYCKTDRTRGVWKAPANVVLNGVSEVSVRVTDDTQGAMNQAGINVIRSFSDRGLVVWGARTLQDDDNWRYIPVRRLFDAAERDIKKAVRAMVFEPNNQLTWKKVQTAVDNYLYSLWQQGGLAGNKAAEAYFVRIGKDITMTQDDINQGKMILQVGMAAVRPAEFIVLQFTQDMTH